ncbi:EpsG family protein [Aquabacterium sp.]|uniref:EpsG family protein n=1 Tax=Aquabacterium sp. TaxID=1872578 RepID=UPI003BB0350A
MHNLFKTHTRRKAFLTLLGAATLSIAAAGKIIGIDADHFQYLSFWEHLDKNNPFNLTRFEPGFVWAAWFAKHLTQIEYNTFIFFTTLISISIKFRLLAKRNYYPILIIGYTTSLYLLHEMTQIRAAVSLGFGYLAIEYFRKRRITFSLASMAIAASLHYSTLILCTSYLYSLIKSASPKSNRVALIATIAISTSAAAVFVSSFNQLNPVLEGYFSNVQEQQVSLLSARTLLLGFILGIALLDLRNVQTPDHALLATSSTIFILFFVFKDTPVIAHRIIEISMFSYFLWVPSMTGKRSKLALAALLTLCLYEGYRMLIRDNIFSG